MLGEKLQIARKESKLTLEQIAERLGISYQAYRKIEKGLNNPSLENLMKIAELYNLSIDYLLGYTDVKRPLRQTKKRIIYKMPIPTATKAEQPPKRINNAPPEYIGTPHSAETKPIIAANSIPQPKKKK